MGSLHNGDSAKKRRASARKSDDLLRRKVNTETVTPSDAKPFAIFSEWSSEADEKAYGGL